MQAELSSGKAITSSGDRNDQASFYWESWVFFSFLFFFLLSTEAKVEAWRASWDTEQSHPSLGPQKKNAQCGSRCLFSTPTQ